MTEQQRIAALRIREKALSGDSSLQELAEIKKEEAIREDRLRQYFLEYLEPSEVDPSLVNPIPRALERGLAGRIERKLGNNPFGKVVERTIRRWLNGETSIDRKSVYHICIAYGLGLDKSSDLFTAYLRTEFTRFNMLEEIVYRYALLKGYDLQETYALLKRSKKTAEISEEITAKNAEVTILTTIIKSAYRDEDYESVSSDDAFIEFVSSQKENFHIVRATRRRDLRDRLNSTGIAKRYLIDSLANGFYITDEDRNFIDDDKTVDTFDEYGYDYENNNSENNDSNDDYAPECIIRTKQHRYFEDALRSIDKREKNFNREFYILCLLVSGESDVYVLNAALTSSFIDFHRLYVNRLFDACIYEACAYAERESVSAYDRFCEITDTLKITRPEAFAYDNSQL